MVKLPVNYHDKSVGNNRANQSPVAGSRSNFDFTQLRDRNPASFNNVRNYMRQTADYLVRNNRTRKDK